MLALHGTVRADSQAAVDAVRVWSERRDGATVITIGSSEKGRWPGFGGAFDISLPAERVLTVETSNGGVRVDGQRDRLTIQTSNGPIDVRNAASTLRLRSSNGNVTASLDRRWSGETIDARTSNGNVEIAVPAGLRASLQASTNGIVRNEANLPTALAGSVPIHATSSNGDVTVR